MHGKGQPELYRPTFLCQGRLPCHPGDGLGDINSALTLENEPSYDTIILDDVHDPASQTATVSTVARPGDSSMGQLTGLSAPISWDLADTTSVDLYTNGQTTVSDPGHLVNVH
jgi:hypothetical protein